MIFKWLSFEPKLQLSSLLLDALQLSRDWADFSDAETSIFSKVRSCCLLFFLPLNAFLSFFLIRTFTSCLVYVFSPPFLYPLDLLDLVFLIRTFSVLHSSVKMTTPSVIVVELLSAWRVIVVCGIFVRLLKGYNFPFLRNLFLCLTISGGAWVSRFSTLFSKESWHFLNRSV